ncbi:N-acetylmuramoyl-L-alanine amidase [Leptolyngbya sp. FACHB-8]|nr:N-acetylmuramoyl-L-alanine amidase [Leptolyngbya sp. FACHB-8]
MVRLIRLAGCFGALLLATPATATELESWRFNARDNAITFVTDAAVRPRAQLIFNPTRLVVDLPGVQLHGARLQQEGSGSIREIRWGQLDPNTARLVVELEPGYTLNLEQVRVEGQSSTEWVVQIPEPELVQSESRESQPIETQPAPSEASSTAVSELEALQVNNYGFYLRLSRSVPAELRRERRGRRYVLELPNTVLADNLEQPPEELEQFGIEELELEEESDPPLVRLTLNLSEAAEWQFNETAAGDGILQPGRARAQAPEPTPSPSSSPSPEPSPESTPVTENQIQAITFAPERSALQIRAGGPLTYDVEQDGDRYRIRFPNTRIGSLPPVDLAASSRLLQVAWEQDGEDAVLDLAVASDIQVGLPVEERTGFRQRGSNQITVPLVRPFWQPNRELPPVSMPGIGDRQTTVVLDPGHGGQDPGAVGIRGLREVDINNVVASRVRDLLQQAGVRVVMTRTDNRTLELEQRVQAAERARANLFVSIHSNSISMSRPDVNGIETFHTSAQGGVLATDLLNSLLEATGSPSRGVKTARFYVIRNTSMPSALVEMGFVTGAEDSPRLATDEYRELLARAIARGILQYIRENR